LPLSWALLFISGTYGGSSGLFSRKIKKTNRRKTTMKMPEPIHHPSSYRDPSGFVFQVNGVYHRQVNLSYAADYMLLMDSGLYATLLAKGWLIAHQEIAADLTGTADWYKTLLPAQLGLITYPYEWGFAQLKDAALHTLSILALSIQKGMILKDATPFNIQFIQGKPVFIDTLSFEKYDASLPWVAYRQFCECFLFPLYLEHYCGIGLNKTLTAYPDGIPADVTARLLPRKSRLNIGALMHVHLPNMVKTRNGAPQGRPPAFSQQKLTNLIQHLESIIKKLKTRVAAYSTWSNYYEGTILSRSYLEEKEKVFRQFLEGLHFHTAIDMGANDGHFSLILSENVNASILALDADATCIDRLYHSVREKKVDNILPLCIDLQHPSPALGFRNKERSSFSDRFRGELVVALALIHHLVLSGNIPIADVAGYLSELTTDWLIIEFVPIEDRKAQELIHHKHRWHQPYDVPSFEQNFLLYFSIGKKNKVPGTERILYLMKKRQP
jgi:hypothetical protein